VDVAGRAEADRGLHGEREQPLSGVGRRVGHPFDVGGRAGRHGHQVRRGELVLDAGVHRAAGAGAQHAFDAAAALAFLDELDESCLLQRSHVVVDPLARQVERRRELGRRGGRLQQLQQRSAQRGELHVQHGPI
jgi:hypothetical protein